MPSNQTNQEMAQDRHWTEIAESVSLVASIAGAGFAVLLEKLIFFATPLSLSLFLNLINRQRLAQTYQHNQQNSPQLERVSTELESLQAAILSLESEINPSYLEETFNTLETNLSNRLSILETLDLKTMEEELAQLRNQSNYALESLAQILQRLDRLPNQDHLEAVENQLTHVSGEIKTLKQEVETDLAQLHGQYGSLQESLHQSFTQFEQSLTNWQEAIQTQIDRLDLGAVQTPSTQLETLGITLDRLGTQSSELLQSMVQVTEQLQQLPEQQLQLPVPESSLNADINADYLKQPFSQLQTQLNQQGELLVNLQHLLEERLEQPSQTSSPSSEPQVSELRNFTDRAEEWVSRIKQGFEGFQSQMDFEPDLSQKDEWGDEDEWETPTPYQTSQPATPSPAPSPTPVKSATGWECIHTFTYPSSPVTCLTISSDGTKLVSGGYQEMHEVNLSSYDVKPLSLGAEELSVSSVALSRDGKTLAAATGEIEIWNLITSKLLQELECEDWTTVVAIGAEGKTLVSAGSEPLEEKSSLRFWDFATGELIRTNYYVDYEIDSLGFSVDGSVLAIAGRNRDRYKGLIQVWQVGANTPQMTLEVPMALYSVALTANGQMLAGGCGDRTIKLWNCSTRGLVRTFSGHEGIVYSVALNPDSQILASGSHDRTIKLWQLETGEEIDTLVGHQGAVTAVAFSGDRQRLISASQDMTLKLWQQTG